MTIDELREELQKWADFPFVPDLKQLFGFTLKLLDVYEAAQQGSAIKQCKAVEKLLEEM